MTDTPQPFDLAAMMKDVSESAKYLKMLIYGDPKVGKTTFAGTAPSPLFLAVEPGTVVLIKNKENKERFKDTKVLDLPNMATLNRVNIALRNNQAPDRKTIVIDTLSEFEDRVLGQYMKYAINKGITKNTNEFNPEFAEYKAVTGMLKTAMIQLRDLERHVIVLCHGRDDADKTRGGMSVDRPGLMPSLSKSLTGMFNLIGYMFVDSDGIHKMRVKPTPNIVAGNHLWDGDPVVDNPTFDIFERAINE